MISGRRESTGFEKLLADDRSSIDEQEILAGLATRNRRRARIKHFIKILLGVLVSSLLVGAVLLFLSSQHSSPKSHKETLEWIPCGSSAAQARAAGCHYEPMQRSWIPDACYTSEPSEEYHPFDDREWYYDANLTQKLDEEGMRKLREGDDLDVYAHFFHNEHCVYCWRKLALAVMNRLPLLDSKVADFMHSIHCAKIVMKEIYDVGMQDIEEYRHEMTFSPLMFQTCVPLNWAELE
ncbi:hypothetical protein F5884DRAFT_669061 [Xylogone sp. PMI_703]|nr:hypothetical protein F5884DRAFT_669061 [Xylogone sp. PMI_703]